MVRGLAMINRVGGEEDDELVRMMDEQSWASKMGGEDDESGWRCCVSFDGSGEEDDELVEVRVWEFYFWEREN